MTFGASRSFGQPPRPGPHADNSDRPAAAPAQESPEDDGFLPAHIDRTPLSEAPRRITLPELSAETAIRGGIFLALGIFAAGLLTWAFHLLAPPEWHYLSPGLLDRLQNNLLVATLSALVFAAARRYL